MKKVTLVLSAVLLLLSIMVTAQETKKGNKPIAINKADKVTVMPSISSRSNGELYPSTEKNGEIQDGRATRHKIVIGKGSDGPDFYAKNPNKMKGKIQGKMPELVFETALSNSQPTDPAGAVGPNHYFAVFNTGFRIFDKSGNPLTGQLGPGNIFPDAGCCDLTVSYDNLADRWVVTFLNGANAGVQVAVSDGPDPLTTNWNVYFFANIADYNKLSVWRDGYYITQNGAPNQVWVLEREAALAGDPDAQMIGFALPGIVTSGFNSAQAFNITDDNHPSNGAAGVVYMQDDAWVGVDNDHIKLWEIDLDTDDVTNSTISDPQEIAVTDFISVFDGGSFANLTQPNGGVDIDALQATIMNQAQFRKFATHNSAIFNFVVDTDETAGELAGIRWMEFRQSGDGEPWSLFQEGTYTAPNGKHAWNGSMAMDSQGNIGIGYTGMAGPTTPTDGSEIEIVSSYYTGRFDGDPAGTMTVEETLIAEGAGNIPGIRYSDYSKIDVDPSDGLRFWFVNEYIGPNGRGNVAGVFQFERFANDVGVTILNEPVSGVLTDGTEIEIEITNFGDDTASNFDVSYQIDGGAIVTETYTGTIATGESDVYRFTTTADLGVIGQTYSITACTALATDENTTNDCITSEVVSIPASDIGVVGVISPVGGLTLSDSEVVTVTIENFGAESQSNFEVGYTIDGGTEVVETVTATLEVGQTLEYSFTTTADFSAIASYTLVARTILSGDSDTSNDSQEVIIETLDCTVNENTTAQPIGPNAGTVTESIITIDQNYDIEDLNVSVNLTHTWVGDLTLELIAPNGTEVLLSDQIGNNGDNYTDTIFDDEADQPITAGAPPYTGTFSPDGSLSDFVAVEETSGDWILRITDNVNGDFGELLDWSLTICGSESVLSTEEELLPSTEFLVINRGGNQFNVSLNTTEINERLNFQVFNITGQKLLDYRLDHNGTGYQYDLDMSYAATGVYILRLGNAEKVKVKRIIVR